MLEKNDSNSKTYNFMNGLVRVSQPRGGVVLCTALTIESCETHSFPAFYLSRQLFSLFLSTPYYLLPTTRRARG